MLSIQSASKKGFQCFENGGCFSLSRPYSRFVIGTLPWYSTLIVLGAALAIWLAVREEKETGLPKDTILDLALRVLPVGILGARIYYVVFSWDAYRKNPVSALYIWEGGLAIYGGLIAGFFCVLFFCRKRGLSLLSVCDTLIPGVALAQSIGRWGNYFNQEAYGLPLTCPTFQFFPIGVQIAENGILIWHMATFFYESILDFGIFLFLILNRRKLLCHRGDCFFTYLFLYGAARLIVENFRMDSLYAGSIRVSQLLSVLLCGVILLLFFLRNRTSQSKQAKCSAGFASGLVLALADIVVLCFLIIYCLRSELLPFTGALKQFAFLTVSSLLMTGSLFLLLHRTRKTEVPDADN